LFLIEFADNIMPSFSQDYCRHSYSWFKNSHFTLDNSYYNNLSSSYGRIWL